MTGRITDWKSFVETGRSFLDANWGCPMFKLIEALDELYRLAYLKAPFPTTNREEDHFLRMCFLVCHRALLSAATSTGSGWPEDGAAITRRALEGAKACLAVKASPSNFSEWKSAELRKGRWESRLRGQKPKPLRPAYKGVSSEPLYEELRIVIAALSDFSVHFTPEHVGQYQRQQSRLPDGTAEDSFGLDEDAVAKEFLMLAGQHRLIIRVFDRCLDGKILEPPEMNGVAKRALNLYKDLLRREGLTEVAATAGDRW